MEKKAQTLSKTEAAEALVSVSKMACAGSQRGIYSRTFGALGALWVGLVILGVTFKSLATIPLYILGIIGYFLYRRKRGVWPREIGTKRDLYIVIVSTLVIIVILVLGGIGWRRYDFVWAPFVSAILISSGTYLLMEFSYHHIWSQSKKRSQP